MHMQADICHPCNGRDFCEWCFSLRELFSMKANGRASGSKIRDGPTSKALEHLSITRSRTERCALGPHWRCVPRILLSRLKSADLSSTSILHL